MIQIATLHGLCVHRAAIYSRIVRDVIFVYSVDGDMGKRQLYATMPACLYDVTGTCRSTETCGVFSTLYSLKSREAEGSCLAWPARA